MREGLRDASTVADDGCRTIGIAFFDAWLLGGDSANDSGGEDPPLPEFELAAQPAQIRSALTQSSDRTMVPPMCEAQCASLKRSLLEGAAKIIK